MKKVLIRLIVLLVIAGGVYYGYRLFQQMPQRQAQIPVTRIRRGDVVVRSYSRGELRAVRSATLTAPNLFGTVQVTRLAALGAFAREKDLIVEFDDAEVLSRLEDKQLEIDQTDEQIKKNQADLNIRNNQDQVELLRAKYSVRRAELEVKRNELISAIDAKKNLLSLEEARRRLRQLESDIKSRQQQALAQLAVLREQRNKGVVELNRERARLNQVKMLSPMSGLVAIKQNRGGFMGMFGMQVPDIREGDQVQPGIPVVDILDLSELEVVARVGELDRANLREGQDVLISLDAVPEKKFSGKIKSMSGTASANMFSSDPAKKFDVIFSIDMRQLLSALGARPDAIQRIMATAEQNRKRPPIQSMGSMMFGGGGMPGMAMAGGFPAGGGAGGFPAGAMAPSGMQGPTAGPGAPQAAPQDGEGEAPARGARSGGRGGIMGSLAGAASPEQMQKVRDAVQKALNGRSMRDLAQEERQKIFQEAMKSAGVKPPPASGQPGATPPAAGGPPTVGFARPGGAATPGEPGGFGGSSGGRQFAQKDLENATLPPPPEEESQLDVLLRPGLLADVEIIVEKVPQALYVPNQAVFEKDGKYILYVKQGNNYEERPIKIAKRSETTTIIESGANAGEVIAMGDPTAKPGDKKKSEEKKGGGAMGAMPAGGR